MGGVLVKTSHHLILGHGDEVLKINTTSYEFGTLMSRNKTSVLLRVDGQLWNLVRRVVQRWERSELTVLIEIKELGHFLRCSIGITRVRETTSWMTEFVKERVAHSVDG